MWHVWRGEVYKRFRWENLREKDHLEDVFVDGRIILKKVKEERWGHGLD